VDLRDQNPVIELVHCERNIVLRLLRLLACDELSVIQAALLIVGVDPATSQYLTLPSESVPHSWL